MRVALVAPEVTRSTRLDRVDLVTSVSAAIPPGDGSLTGASVPLSVRLLGTQTFQPLHNCGGHSALAFTFVWR